MSENKTRASGDHYSGELAFARRNERIGERRAGGNTEKDRQPERPRGKAKKLCGEKKERRDEGEGWL